MKMTRNRPGWMTMAALAFAIGAQAADKTWNDTSSDFNSAGSWNVGLPGSGDAAVFAADADTNIINQPNLTDNVTLQQVRFNQNASTNYVLSASAGKKLTLTSVGSSSTAGTGAAVMGNNNNGVNTISAPIVLGAASYSTQYFRINTSGGALYVPGNVSEANAGIALCAIGSGSAVIRLSGSNSFSGGVILDTTVLEVGGANAIPAAGSLTLGSGTLRSSDLTTRTLSNPFTLGASLSFGSSTPANQGTLIFTNSGTLTADFTTTIAGANPTPVSAVAFEGAIGESGSCALKVAGSTSGVGLGYLFLLGANTYSGITTINSLGGAGPVVINTIGNEGEASSSLGAPTGANRVLVLAAGNSSSSHGNLRYVGGDTSTDRPITAGNAGTSGGTAPTQITLDASGYGSLVFTSPMTLLGGTTASSRKLNLTGTSSGANTFSNTIPNFATGSSLFVSKEGSGTWVLAGTNGFAGGLAINAGTLVLDYATNAPVVNAANALTLGGGELFLKAKKDSSSAQTLASLTLTSITGSKITLEPNGGSMALTLGAWTRNANASLYLNLPASASVSASPALVNGLLPYAVVQDATGTGYATRSGGGVGTDLVRYTYIPTNALTPTVTGSQTTNLFHSGSLTLNAGGGYIGQTLSIDTTGGGVLNLSGGAARFGADGGILFYGSGSYAVTNGSLGATASAGILYFHQYADGVVVLPTIAAGNVNKTGPGTLVVATNTAASSRAIRIFGGAVRVDDVSVMSNNSLVLAGGVLELGGAGDMTNSLGSLTAGSLQFSGDGGFSAHGTTRTVRLYNSATNIDWSSANFVPANNALLLSGKDANALIDFQNGLGFGYQQRLVRVADGSAPVDARLSGLLSGGYGGGLIKEGNGALEITGTNNSYQGETWIKAGVLLVNNASGEGTGSGAVTVFNGGAIGGTGTVNRLTLRSGGKLLALGTPGGVSALKVTGTLNISAGTLDFSGIGSLPPSDLVLAECGTLIGSAFASVTNLPAGRTVGYTSTGIVLKGSAAGTVIMIR